jgi:flagellar basal body-associated protein FliL
MKKMNRKLLISILILSFLLMTITAALMHMSSSSEDKDVKYESLENQIKETKIRDDKNEIIKKDSYYEYK